MNKKVSQILALSMCGLFVASGAIVQSAGAMDKQPVGSSSSPSHGSVPQVSENTSGKAGAQWSDQLVRERDEAKNSKELAQKERDQAQKELDQAKEEGSGTKSIQGQSRSGSSGNAQGNKEIDQIVKERDQYLKERDALQQETSNLRQERDGAMSAISGGSALDAVDSGMPVKERH